VLGLFAEASTIVALVTIEAPHGTPTGIAFSTNRTLITASRIIDISSHSIKTL